MIQIRDVPDEVHSILKSRAAREGMSLSDFLKRELQHTAERSSIREWLDQTAHIRPIAGTRRANDIIRELRDAR